MVFNQLKLILAVFQSFRKGTAIACPLLWPLFRTCSQMIALDYQRIHLHLQYKLEKMVYLTYSRCEYEMHA